MNPATLAAVGRAFDAIDATTENDQAATLRAEIAECETALESAIERRRAIAAELGAMALQPHGGDGARIADALIGGSSATTAIAVVASQAELERESDGLARAVAELRQRVADRQQQIAAVRRAPVDRVIDATRTLMDSLIDEMREAGARFVQAYVKAEAISLATRSNLMPGQAKELARAMTAPGAFKPFVPHASRDVPVPDDIAALFARLSGKGEGLAITTPATVTLF